MTETAEPTPAPAKRRKSRRKFRRIFVYLLILIGVLLLIVQVILLTDIPRNLIVRQLQSQLGLRINVNDLTVRWNGHTTIENLTVALPLSDQLIVVAPRIDLRHTSLPMLAITRSFNVSSVRLDSPVFRASQNVYGRWNVEDLLTQLSVHASPGSADGSSPGVAAPMNLPRIEVQDATIHVVDGQQQEVVVHPIALLGQPQGPAGYTFELAVADRRLTARGQIVTAGQMPHEITITANDLEPLARQMIAGWPEDVSLQSRWNGRIVNGRLVGRLNVSPLLIDLAGLEPLLISGPIDVAQDAAGFAFYPRNLTIHSPDLQRPAVTVAQGTVRVDSSLTIDDVELLAVNGVARISATSDFSGNAIEVNARWRDIEIPGNIRQAGELTLKFDEAFSNQPRVSVQASSQGTAPDGQWNAQLNSNIEGTSWSDLVANVEFPRISWESGQRVFVTEQLGARVLFRNNTLSFDSLTLRDTGQITGQGEYRFDDHNWWVYVAAQRAPLAPLYGLPIEFSINAWGSPELIHLQQLYAQAANIVIQSSGWYCGEWENPFALEVNVFEPEIRTATAGAPLPLQGSIHSYAYVLGKLEPKVNLQLAGFLSADDLVIADRPVGSLDAQLQGSVDGQRLQLATTEMELFGGQWRWSAMFDTSERVDRAFLNVDVRGLAIPELLRTIESPLLMTGSINGRWQLIHDIATGRYVLDGVVDARDVDLDLSESAAEYHVPLGNITGRTRITNDRINIEQVVAKSGDGTAYGSLSIALNQPSRPISISYAFNNWLVLSPSRRGKAIVQATGGIEGTLADGRLAGKIEASSALSLDEHGIGTLRFAADLRQDTLRIRELAADAFGGTARGTFLLDLESPADSAGALRLDGIDLPQLIEFVPVLDGLTGTLNGTIDLQSMRSNPRALGPLLVAVKLQPVEADWRGIAFADTNIDLYVDLNRDWELQRAVSGESSVLLAGGVAQPWLRLTRHSDQRLARQFAVDFDSIDLQLLTVPLEQADKPIIGRVSGSLLFLDNWNDRATQYAEGNFRLSDTDLKNVPGFDQLYASTNALNNEARGYGELRFRLDAERLELTRMEHFERGLQINALATIPEVFNLPDSPIEASIVGSVRPLKDVNLPFMADLDDITNALQASITPIVITGTVREPQVRVGRFEDIGDAMRKILVGETRTK